MALDLVHNELIVANSFFNNTLSLGGLLVFPRTATGNVAPVRQITGTNTGLCNPIGMTLDRVHDELYVTNAAANSACQPSVVVFSRSAEWECRPSAHDWAGAELRSQQPGRRCGGDDGRLLRRVGGFRHAVRRQQSVHERR